MDMNLDEAIKILTEEYPAYLKEKAIKVIYRLVEESAYYRDLVKLERKEKEQLKKSLKGQIKKKDTEIIEAKEANRQLTLVLETSKKETQQVLDDYQDLGKEKYKLECELEKKEAIINEMAKDIKSADEFLDSMGYMGEYAKFTIEEIIEEYERIEKF